MNILCCPLNRETVSPRWNDRNNVIKKHTNRGKYLLKATKVMSFQYKSTVHMYIIGKVWKKLWNLKKRRGLSKWLFWYLWWCDETKITKDYIIYIIKMMMTRLLYSIYLRVQRWVQYKVQQENNIVGTVFKNV